MYDKNENNVCMNTIQKIILTFNYKLSFNPRLFLVYKIRFIFMEI